ncbi:MAG: prolipoprotein diacylglyceryl transferase [Chloroflexi bacterium RBG_16_50_9]|nr:MAG: prolipoprotein diacylglyceryl transferase [Chloroflexi bacterium RBG_16_50_9]
MIYINVSPVAFTIGSFSVHWYGIMVALAVLSLIMWALFAVRHDNRLSYDIMINAALVGIPSGIVFARLVHVADYWDYYSQHLNEIIGGSGLAIYGAVLGAALGIWVYSRFRKISFGHLADVISPGIILAQAIGRVGCTFNGCCYGVETDIFCAVVYSDPESFAPIGIPVHPTQIYEIVYNLIVFGVLLLLRQRFRPDGSLFLIYLTLYSLWRFAIDFIREGTPFLLGLHEAQVISIIVLIITITLIAWRTRWVGKNTEPG